MARLAWPLTGASHTSSDVQSLNRWGLNASLFICSFNTLNWHILVVRFQVLRKIPLLRVAPCC